MLKVVGCFVGAHDPWLVVLAISVCALASVTTMELLCHARKAAGHVRAAWLGVATVSGGAGIWATHFIAMLAFEPGVSSGYDLALTAVSLLFAIVLTGAGLLVATRKHVPQADAIGGAIVGAGISAMHYTGMSAFEVAGHVVWDPALVAQSLLSGEVFGALALVTALRWSHLRGRLAGAALLLLAICSDHFTAMGAATIVPDPSVGVSTGALPTHVLAFAVAFASLAILLLACGALASDLRDRRHAVLEGARLRGLANAAVEGLVVCRGEVIVCANDSFARLAGSAAQDLAGASISRFLPHLPVGAGAVNSPEHHIESVLHGTTGALIPVELIVRPIDYADRPHHAIAVRDLRARRNAEKQIHFLAHHDPLTGLANRASFTLQLKREIKAADAHGRKLAVLCLDLDRFKEVNDLFGHAAGDTMLQDLARLVTGLLDENQMMARLGGDEFAVLTRCDDRAEAGRLAERILDVLRDANAERAGPEVATSIGIALYPDDATERHLLLSYADTALYRAKSQGRATYRSFETTMGLEIRDRRMMEHDLRHAVARGEMHIVYQPQTDVGTGAITGLEALLRWRHPSRGSISPAVFIPLAEESGLILQLGEWVLREACREAASWQMPLVVAVNVSGVQIHSAQFGRLVQEVLALSGLDPARLELEITETALIRDPGRALATLRQLKMLGISIAMDDFGTGYSSLSNLRSFPFDRIKIDASFVKSVDSNQQAAAIVRSVLGLGRGLGLPVIAEGVETEAELTFLRAENCAAFQGYLVGKPVPIEELTAYTNGPIRAASRAA